MDIDPQSPVIKLNSPLVALAPALLVESDKALVEPIRDVR